MNEIEKVLTYIDRADAIERDLAAQTAAVFRTACDELQAIIDAINERNANDA